MMTRNCINVLCIGPASTVRGGPSRVIGKIKDRFPNHVRFRIVATHSAYTGSAHPDRGSKVAQMAIFVRAFVTILLTAVCSHDTIFHIHLSQRGSTLRKGVICILLRILRCRYVVHSHAADDALFHDWVPQFARRMIIWGIKNANYFIALTHFWSGFYEHLLRLPHEKMLLLPNPADLPSSLPTRPVRAGLNLLFLGRVGQRKGAFDVIRAFADVPGHVREHCCLTLAGDGETDVATALARRLGCASQTAILGWVSGDEVDRLLAAADVLLLPTRGEGMSNALLEAMGWGLAVVTTGVGGADEFLQSAYNSILVRPGDVGAVTAAICELQRDVELRLRLGREARRSVCRFSLEEYVAGLVHIWESTASDGPPTSSLQPAQP